MGNGGQSISLLLSSAGAKTRGLPVLTALIVALSLAASGKAQVRESICYLANPPLHHFSKSGDFSVFRVIRRDNAVYYSGSTNHSTFSLTNVNCESEFSELVVTITNSEPRTEFEKVAQMLRLSLPLVADSDWDALIKNGELIKKMGTTEYEFHFFLTRLEAVVSVSAETVR
jgi:hypothetical protein